MGIPRFYGSFLKEKYPQCLVNELPDGIVSSLNIDMNSLLHEVNAIAFKESDDFDNYFNLLKAKLLEIIEELKPQDLVILAIDGVAPMSKIIQQRQRRYKSILKPPNPYFDSNSITPGTDFMIKLDKHFREWFEKELTKMYKFKLIYSSHLSPGEGEHKILDYIRDGELDQNKVHVIYGLDADLIVLSLISNLNYIYLLRNDIADVIDITKLRLQLINDLTGEEMRNGSIYDFAVMSFFVGSDFLPVSPAFESLKDNLVNMIQKYRKINIQFTNQGRIIWSNFYRFLKSVSFSEEYYLQKESRKEKAMGYVMMENSIINGEFNYDTFRSLWYANEFQEDTITIEMIYLMCKDYLKTSEWILNYYINGNRKSDQYFYYHFNHSPLIKDVVASINRYSKEKKVSPITTVLNPVYQLICVIPPHSFAVLPNELRQYLSNNSVCFADMLPKQFELEVDGKNAEWQAIPLLPFPDINRIIFCISNGNEMISLMNSLEEVNDFIYQRK